MTRISLSIIIVFLALFGLYILSDNPEQRTKIASSTSEPVAQELVAQESVAQEPAEEAPIQIVANQKVVPEESFAEEEKEPAAQKEIAEMKELTQATVKEEPAEPKSDAPIVVAAPTTDEVDNDIPIYQRAGASSAQGIAATILFASDSTELTNSAQTAISELATQLQSNSELTAHITGNTDSVGNPQVNEWFSQERARVVAKELRTRGVTGTQIQTSALIGSKPSVGRENWKVRQQKRRVEIVLK